MRSLALAACFFLCAASVCAQTSIPLKTQTKPPGKNGQLLYNANGAVGAEDPLVTPNVASILNKANGNVGGSTVKTLSVTVTSSTAGNTFIVAVGAGEVANGSTIVLTVTDTNSDTCSLVVTQAISTTFAASIYQCQAITAANTAVTATFSGASSANTTIAMQVWEVSVPVSFSLAFNTDQSAAGTATGTAIAAGPAGATVPNELAFAAFGVGTGAQTVTVAGTGSWSNDSGQINPTSASGLFSFVGLSQFFPSPQNVTAAGTITSEPWVAAVATFKYVMATSDSILCPYSYVNNAEGTSGSYQFAAVVTGKSVYVCYVALTGAATTVNTVKLTYGTGTNCATGQNDLSVAVPILATATASPAGAVSPIPPNAFLATPVSQAACLTLSASQLINAQVLWGYR